MKKEECESAIHILREFFPKMSEEYGFTEVYVFGGIIKYPEKNHKDLDIALFFPAKSLVECISKLNFIIDFKTQPDPFPNSRDYPINFKGYSLLQRFIACMFERKFSIRRQYGGWNCTKALVEDDSVIGEIGKNLIVLGNNDVVTKISFLQYRNEKGEKEPARKIFPA